jgi:acyl-CoA synthetase (NDP forming)
MPRGKKRRKKVKKKVKPTIRKMPDEKAYELLKRYRIKLPKYAFCKNEKQLEKALKKVGFPCVMKVSNGIIHKTEAKGVVLNINSEDEARKTFYRLMKIKGCKKVLVQEMITDGYEIIIGAKKDPQFGRIVALGAGGIFTELLRDVSFRICPISRSDAESMLKEVKFSDVLFKGFRGIKPVKPDVIVDVLLAVSRLIEKNKKIKELDINPLLVTRNKAVAVDVRIILE